MIVTLYDLLQLDIFQSLTPICGKKGLNSAVTKVGILDFEFTRTGASHVYDQHWQEGELVLSSLLYSKSEYDLLSAVKRLKKSKV